MKLISFQIALAFCTLSCIATGQNTITLSFTGMDRSNYAKTDTIKIHNTVRNCDTTLFWPDTVLSVTVGIRDLTMVKEDLQVFQNVPNPVRENTSISVYLPLSGNVDVNVSRLSGGLVSSFNRQLKKGFHTFLFSPGSAETYVFTAICQSGMKSIKIVALPVAASPVCRLEYRGIENGPSVMKPSGTTDKFFFASGDELQFTGITDKYVAIINSVPHTDTLYRFDFTHFDFPCSRVTTVTYMGQTYHTVQAGSQCWLRENLNAGREIDSTQIPSNNHSIEKYCYNDDKNYCMVYGGLYTWNEMMQYATAEGARGICPAGWHIPADAEWITLTDELGSIKVAGGKMKEIDFDHWAHPNTGADNSSGFTALPGGYRLGRDSQDIYMYAHFWSSTPVGNQAGARALSSQTAEVSPLPETTNLGFSVRCIRDSQ
ncbi:MAG: fibrobacter succinogenes major paralogous domain-containing protein [Bacteroidota bacterium]